MLGGDLLRGTGLVDLDQGLDGVAQGGGGVQDALVVLVLAAAGLGQGAVHLLGGLHQAVQLLGGDGAGATDLRGGVLHGMSPSLRVMALRESRCH